MILTVPILLALFALWLSRHAIERRIAIGTATRHQRSLQRHAENIWSLEREFGWEPWGVFGLEPTTPKPKSNAYPYKCEVTRRAEFIPPMYLDVPAKMPTGLSYAKANEVSYFKDLVGHSAVNPYQDQKVISDEVSWATRTQVA